MYFAVRIKGVKPPNDLSSIAQANYVVLVTVLLTLAGTYFWFHRRTINNAKKAQTAQEDPDETEARSEMGQWHSTTTLYRKSGAALKQVASADQ